MYGNSDANWYNFVGTDAVIKYHTLKLIYAQFKKREKHPWRSVTFSKITGFIVEFY